jgi:hypothetical protein
VTCIEIRERLTEHSLGVLPKPDAREVERHLEWCTGCRKEASELLEGAASMALALPVVKPSSALEGRILERFRMATGRVPMPHRGRVRVLVAATMTAVFLAVGSLGWAISQQHNVQTLHEQVTDAVTKNNDLLILLSIFRGNGRTSTATLSSPSGGQGFGQAIVFTAPTEGFLLVDIAVLPKNAGPFTVQLVGNGVIDAGQLNLATSDRPVLLKWFTDEPLGRMSTVTVIDRSTGVVVLTGKIKAYTAP